MQKANGKTHNARTRFGPHRSNSYPVRTVAAIGLQSVIAIANQKATLSSMRKIFFM